MADGGNNNLPDPSDVRDIAANLADAVQAAQEMQKHFRRSNQDIVNLDQILEHIVRNARDLPEGILTAADLQKRLTTDAELFKEVQEEALNIGLQQIDEWYEVAVDKAAENLKISLEQLDVAEQFLLRAAEEAKTEDELLAVAVQQARVEEQKQAL